MNVTPPPGLYKVMAALVDKTCGEAPTDKETTPAADERREVRRAMFDVLHNMVRLSMRVGAQRFCEERGLPVVEDQVKPDPVGKAVRDAQPVSNVVQIHQ